MALSQLVGKSVPSRGSERFPHPRWAQHHPEEAKENDYQAALQSHSRGPKEPRPAETRKFGPSGASQTPPWNPPKALEGLQRTRRVRAAPSRSTESPSLQTRGAVWAQGVSSCLGRWEGHSRRGQQKPSAESGGPPYRRQWEVKATAGSGPRAQARGVPSGLH